MLQLRTAARQALEARDRGWRDDTAIAALRAALAKVPG